MDKDYLILKRASASRPSGERNDDDYDVLADRVVVGRILKVHAAPVGAPWMWTLAFGQHEDRTPTHGYEPTRDAAMTAFATSSPRGRNGVPWELQAAVHVDHRACLPDPVHGLHNVSLRCIWRFDAALRGGVQNGARPVQILRDGGRTDIRRPWHDRYWAGPAAAADPWEGVIPREK